MAPIEVFLITYMLCIMSTVDTMPIGVLEDPVAIVSLQRNPKNESDITNIPFALSQLVYVKKVVEEHIVSADSSRQGLCTHVSCTVIIFASILTLTVVVVLVAVQIYQKYSIHTEQQKFCYRESELRAAVESSCGFTIHSRP